MSANEVVGIIIVVGACLAALVFLYCFLTPKPESEAERTARQLREAQEQANEIFQAAKVAMEEAVGRRRPDERRVADRLSGSWTDW